MNPDYHLDASAFSRVDLELLGIALAHFPALLKDGSEMLQYKHEAATYLRAHAKDGSFEKEGLNASLAWLGSGETSVSSSPPLPERQAAWLREAKEHADRGRNDLAQQALSQIFDYETHPDVLSLGCRVALAVDPKGAGTREKCLQAVERSPSDPMAVLMRAQTELLAGDAGAGAESLVRAGELVDRVNTSEAMWDYFATLAQSAGCLTLAEKAARNAGSERSVLVQKWAVIARRRAAIPLGLSAAEECRMQSELTPVLALLAAKRWQEAEATAQIVLAAHPNASAPLAALCEALTASVRDNDAEPFCNRALAVDPEATSAHYWLGVIAWRRGDKSAAATSFSRALELDPEAAHAQEMLKRTGVKPPVTAEQAKTCDTLVDGSAAFAKTQQACGMAGLRITRDACRANIAQCSSADLTALTSFADCFGAIAGCATPSTSETSAALSACGAKLKQTLSAACSSALRSK
jgi:tetratricopeptide (TPR) repeat protein